MRVFNVPSSEPFLRAVIEALVDGRLVPGFAARADPGRLADVTLYLPTRRAGRLAREVFLDVLGGDAVLLPRIVALGSVDEDELEFAGAGGIGGSDSISLPPTLDELERRLTLAQMVGAWAAQLRPASLVAGGPASTLALAGDLARLMDDMVTRGVGWDALDGIVPDDLDVYWQYTLDFLKIARDTWPAHLKEIGKIEPAARRDLLIAAEAARLTSHARGPVIAAGSTGSMPATAAFLRAIAELPQGAVVLPGLDTDLDEAAWQMIGGAPHADGTRSTPSWSHPQVALHHLVTDVLGLTRGDIVTLGMPEGRELLTSEAMRPAEASGQWHARLAEPDVATRIANGMQNLSVIEATNPEMEALAIAVALREARALGRTAALVTSDRTLARRVMASLDRWQLDYDDSGGDALVQTPAGVFARLAAQTVADELAPPTLLALLKHPLFRLGKAKDAFGALIGDFELALLRGTRPAPGSKGLQQALANVRAAQESLHRTDPRRRLTADDLDAVGALIAALADAVAPLETLPRGQPQDFVTFAACHERVLKALSKDDRGGYAAFEGPDGNALARAFDDLLRSDSRDGEALPSGLMMETRDYPEVFQTAFADRIVRRPQAAVTSLRIYGPLEARLTQTDRVVLGGLVEDVWPPAPRPDPWLSRPMRHQLGLDLPERRIGLSAHDFAQLLGMREVILSRAAKVGGAPAVPSRFLNRLEAVAGKEAWSAARQRGAVYARLANGLDHPHEVIPAPQPMPKPPLALRPLKMSVTDIEHWLRDPYTIYAKHILKLAPLDPVDMPPTAADRGSAIHAALGDFTSQYPQALPDDVAQALIGFGARHFAPLMDRPEARALWWPRFQRIAAWFAGWEQTRRAGVTRIASEIYGTIHLPLDDGRAFELSARADRIEHRSDGRYALVDYKTGNPPTGKQVYLGLSPQLTLEAAILRGGGFRDIPANASVSELVYVRLSGNNPAGDERVLDLRTNRGDDAQTPDDAADEAREKLAGLIRRYHNPDEPYRSVVLTMWANRYGSYDDLARVKEWSSAGGGVGE